MENTSLMEVMQHYQMWTDDNKKRQTRKNGWDDVTDAYFGNLPSDWPYTSKVVDPKIRTSLIEKNARILNAKLHGRLVPREGGDTIGALINNAILDYQWDAANDGGSMLQKFELSDMDTRLYASKFALVYWKHELDDEGKVIFDGNEFMPLDIRNCGLDPNCQNIKNAKWFQIRTWETIEDLKNSVDAKGKPIYKNLGKLQVSYDKKNKKLTSATNTDFTSRVKTIRGLEDRTGEDMAFPVVKIVTEYRKDKWITFAPDFNLILREIDNPYIHRKIPVAQLRYYPLDDDPMGESEVEPVLGIWIAIQAVINAYLDEVVLKMRPPLKIIENAARIETIEYGPDAQWLVDRQDAVEEMNSSADSRQYFQTSYQALSAAFNLAMGDLSQQNSSLNPFTIQPKTATEVRASVQQQTVRDQKNQNDLAEFIKDIMSMWIVNNRQFLFSDRSKTSYLLRIIGKDKWEKLQRTGLADMEMLPEVMTTIKDILAMHPDLGDEQLSQMYEAGMVPAYPVVLNPKEKNPEKMEIVPKMSITKDIAEINVIPEDLEGTYDYIPDVKSMSLSASDMMIQGRQMAIQNLTNNPIVLQLLQQEGWTPSIKDLMVDNFEDLGLHDAEKYFQRPQNQGATQMGGPSPDSQIGGLPTLPQANTGGSIQQPMAGPIPGGVGPTIPEAVPGPVGQGDGL